MVDVVLNATSPNNYVIDDLTCYANATDADEDSLTYYGRWYRNGITFAREAWSVSYNGLANSNDYAQGVAVDSSGNVYVAGYSFNGANHDYYTVKYDSGGSEVWDVSYAGPANGYDAAWDVAVDGSGNVYVTGSSFNGANYDYFTIKYNSGGSEVWKVAYNGPANGADHAQGVAVDGSGNVYVTGYSNNGANYDYFTIKYDSGGSSSTTGTRASS